MIAIKRFGMAGFSESYGGARKLLNVCIISFLSRNVIAYETAYNAEIEPCFFRKAY